MIVTNIPVTSKAVEDVVAGVPAGGTEGGGGGTGAVACSAAGTLAAGEIQAGAQTESFVEQTGLASRSQPCSYYAIVLDFIVGCVESYIQSKDATNILQV